jgi:hypothetical protein
MHLCYRRASLRFLHSFERYPGGFAAFPKDFSPRTCRDGARARRVETDKHGFVNEELRNISSWGDGYRNPSFCLYLSVPICQRADLEIRVPFYQTGLASAATTRIFSESGFGLAASWTAAAVFSSGNRCMIKPRTSN